MGIRELERGILDELRDVTKNPRIRAADIMEWSTGDIKPHAGETLIHLPKLNVNVAFKQRA